MKINAGEIRVGMLLEYKNDLEPHTPNFSYLNLDK